MNRISRSALVFGIAAAVLMTGCATTKITSAWKEPSYQAKPQKVMIIGIVKELVNRRILEEEFARQLKARGNEAMASYTVIPDEKETDDKLIAAQMKEQGADAVLITRLAKKETVYTYAPGCRYYPPSYYGTWHDYYVYGCQDMYSPGYMAEDQYAFMETNLYDAGKDNLVWSASSKTEVMNSDQGFTKSYVEAMIKKMAAQKLIK